MVRWLGKNVRYHVLLAVKKIKNWWKSSKKIPKNEILDQKMNVGAAYLLISDFLVDSQSQQKLTTKFFHITIRWLYKRFAIHSNPLWSLEFLIQIDLKHGASTIQFFLKKTSSYKSHLTQQNKNYTPVAQLKTLLTLQIFQKTCLWLLSDETLTLHHFYAPKNGIFKVLGKQM